MAPNLTPDRAYIFRITHRDNLPWIIENGLYCRASDRRDPAFITIGNTDLIERRRTHPVPEAPGGTLSDYVPFYFTPFSPMMYNIKTGWGGIRQRDNEEIAIIVSSLPKLVESGVRFLFTDRHAYLSAAQFYSNLEDLARLDWRILRNRDFKHDAEDPEKTERYQAEALIHRHVPVAAILGIACYNDGATNSLKQRLGEAGEHVNIITKRDWYF